MKPDWKDAPEWAQWLARDKDGRWFWYKDEPEIVRYIPDPDMWHSKNGQDYEEVIDEKPWYESLEERP